jgi:hypothetical protein
MIVIECSTCPTVFSSFLQLVARSLARGEARRRGWLARQDGDGAWRRYCPSCLNRRDWLRSV